MFNRQIIILLKNNTKNKVENEFRSHPHLFKIVDVIVLVEGFKNTVYKKKIIRFINDMTNQ